MVSSPRAPVAVVDPERWFDTSLVIPAKEVSSREVVYMPWTTAVS